MVYSDATSENHSLVSGLNPYGGPAHYELTRPGPLASATYYGVNQTPAMAGDSVNHTFFLAWRNLHLSRAKLKASSRTSALLSGFAMVAMVEVQLSKNIPTGLLVAFAMCTTLLVAIHMLALMISTCILPHVEAVSSMHAMSAVNESPHAKMHIYIEMAWVFSTVVGLMLFMVEIALLCWVKFFDVSQEAAWASTALLVPIVCIFALFALHFYRKLVTHKYEITESGIRELEKLKGQLDQPVPAANTESTYANSDHIV
ncbi:calcium release-activated calcium channel protein 1-like isoform X5 [Pollicipes pollicipes]|nr:calcium release-activated calcium channel protein 1-like isoform X5 [Pollicipes pollicipes]XP_037092640.1 calcium release-activated calcium channel protein 1-like isoform X5 [Pollicipes pollicipes]XP_037092641.1 calcium release-activated calcium channel protein 1-like isoform X5 [Pollicipes pollicipes]XP_037092642.1 calcium release-activated calcium channel protein 1-like isoform X5 [Pollicipes pollicipes]